MLVFQQKKVLMKQFLPILARNPLMENMSEEQISSLLSCLKPQLLSCQKGNIIFHQDDPARFFGVVLSGTYRLCVATHRVPTS